jgi:uncharacterized membrane protein SpoIIM required for sporulation
MGIDLVIALAVMVLGTVVGWLLVSGNPDWYYSLMAGAAMMCARRQPRGSAAHPVRAAGPERAVDVCRLPVQQQRAGFADCLCPRLCLWRAFGSAADPQHRRAGALLWLYHGQGLTLELVGWLAIHGTTELFAILLAGAAGLHIGRAMAFPGEQPVLTAAAVAGRRAAQVMVGVVLMLVLAALLEGFGRQLIDATYARLIIGGAMLALWNAYFFAYRPARVRVAG